MGDVSELFKSYFQELKRAKTMGLVSNANRKECLMLARKTKRDSLMNFRRNIDENASPYITPLPKIKIIRPVVSNNAKPSSQIMKNSILNKKTSEPINNNRLERLAKWKAEKEERKKKEKSKAKPIFKVCHISSNTLPDVATANQVIKGKPIATPSKTNKSQFAPPNHSFRAPKGIKPIELNFSSSKFNKNSQKDTTHISNDIQYKKTKTNKLQRGLGVQEKKILETQPSKKLCNQKLDESSHNNRPNTRSNMQTRSLKRQPLTCTPRDKKAIKTPTIKNGTTNTSKNPKLPKVKTIESNNASNPHKDLVDDKPKLNVDLVAKTKSTKSMLKQTLKKSKSVDFKNECSLNPDRVQEKKSEINVDLTSKLANISLESSKCNINGTVVNKTPNESENIANPLIYGSPFITLSRGKQSAREEYKVRRSQGELFPESIALRSLHSADNYTNPESQINYFTNILNMEIDRITALCDKWQEHLDSLDIPEEPRSSIDVAIGQAKLLMTEKCKQFRSLICQCQSPIKDQNPVTCQDLHGYWDVMYLQVEDVNKRFNNLEKLKENNWEEVLSQKKFPVKRTRRTKKPVGTSTLKDLIRAARQKKKIETTEDDTLIEGGYLKVQTPVKQTSVSEINISKCRRSSVLHASKTPCVSPGLTMMKISQSIKQGHGLTPAKSILKADNTKSTGKKSVIFKDDLLNKPLCKVALFTHENKENVCENTLVVDRALSPRRSARLNKI